MEIEDIELSLLHVKCMVDLLKDNEYKDFFYRHLINIEVELKRQLTNLQNSSKIKE